MGIYGVCRRYSFTPIRVNVQSSSSLNLANFVGVGEILTKNLIRIEQSGYHCCCRRVVVVVVIVVIVIIIVSITVVTVDDAIVVVAITVVDTVAAAVVVAVTVLVEVDVFSLRKKMIRFVSQTFFLCF